MGDPLPDRQEEAACPLALEGEGAVPDRVVDVAVRCLVLGVPWPEDEVVVEAFQEAPPLGELELEPVLPVVR